MVFSFSPLWGISEILELALWVPFPTSLRQAWLPLPASGLLGLHSPQITENWGLPQCLKCMWTPIFRKPRQDSICFKNNFLKNVSHFNKEESSIFKKEIKVTSVSSVAQSCMTLCNPVDCSTLGPVHHQLPELAQTHVHGDSDAIQPSHPLSSPSPPIFNVSQHQGLFQGVSSSHQVAKVLEFQLEHQSFQWVFRTDF